MVFKRRDKRSLWRSVVETLMPKKGWKRAITYVGHRLRRLPDSPHNIALGIAFGVFVCFTPLFGFHILLAMGLAAAFRANVVAAVFGTFFGTPPTFVIIAAINFPIGNWIFGTKSNPDHPSSVLQLFGQAFGDFWHNFKAMFGTDVVDWSHLISFFYEVFLPYAVGGIIPGVITASIAYAASKPLIFAYQHRRRGRLIARFKQRQHEKKIKADDNGQDA